MNERKLRILVVDDDEDDYVIARDLLSDIPGIGFDVDWVPSYDQGLEALQRGEHDLYLLDYRLGVASGLELVKQALHLGCKAPLILMTGQGDREVDVEAIRSGADDYLVKGQVDSDQFERSIRHAIERRRLLAEIELRERELEVSSLTRLSRDTKDPGPGPREASGAPLKEALPDAFGDLVTQYAGLLDEALGEPDSREGLDLFQQLGAIGRTLGALNASATDAVDVHTDAFRKKLSSVNHQRAQAYVREGRLMLIELLSRLVSHYRDESAGIRSEGTLDALR